MYMYSILYICGVGLNTQGVVGPGSELHDLLPRLEKVQLPSLKALNSRGPKPCRAPVGGPPNPVKYEIPKL